MAGDAGDDDKTLRSIFGAFELRDEVLGDVVRSHHIGLDDAGEVFIFDDAMRLVGLAIGLGDVLGYDASVGDDHVQTGEGGLRCGGERLDLVLNRSVAGLQKDIGVWISLVNIRLQFLQIGLGSRGNRNVLGTCDGV